MKEQIGKEPILLTVVTVMLNPLKTNRRIPLQNCITSTANQTFQGIEHLIIDGGSSDGTVALLEEWKKEGKIRYISEPDHGIYDAMNKGIRNAQGKYVMFLNSDDAFLYQDSVANVIECLEKNNADYSYADSEVYAENHSKILHTWKGTLLDIPFGYYPCHQTFFCKKSVLEKLGGFRENYMANDNLLMLQVITGGWKGVYVPQSIIAFHAGGASADMIKKKMQMKMEHFAFFQKECGFSLSDEDLNYLYEKCFFQCPKEKISQIVSRLNREDWIQHFLNLYLNNLEAPKRVKVLYKVKLFSFFQIFAFRNER